MHREVHMEASMNINPLPNKKPPHLWACLSAILLAGASTAAVGDSSAGEDAAAASTQTPLSIKQQGYFFVDQQYYTATKGEQFLANQVYVEFQIPTALKHPYPIIFFPGGGQTGTNFMGTPDGREGWAQFFLA